MAAWKEILGDKLLSGDQMVDVDTALGASKAIALYFRGFTPVFAEAYTKDLKAKGLEVVFVSSDRDEKAFGEYAAEQPWLSLPYEARKLKEALSKKYKVSGIPSLVILDPAGEIITKDGRECISRDPTGQDFPWVPPTLDELLDTTFVGHDGAEVSFSELRGKKPIGLYFSAHWCPPCKAFTPELVRTYKKIHEEGKDFEIIFVSSDRDEAAFDSYFGEMPWLALPFSDRKRKADLSSHFGVEGIPSFVMLDEDGSLISDGARSAVDADPEGKEFPWFPKPVNDLHSPDGINDTPSLCVLMEKAEAPVQEQLAQALLDLAEPTLAKAKEEGNENPYCFFTATKSGGVVEKIRQLTKVGDAAEVPVVVLLDVADEGSFYRLATPEDGKITGLMLADFLKAFEAGTLDKSSF